LDGDGLLLDFHALEADLAALIEPLHNRNLNETPPFDDLNPTAEHVAGHLGRELAARLPEGVHLVGLSVTEAVGCQATWRPPAPGRESERA
ncbi:MAG: 6-carboxytetrahydropterin synthase, partial [Planctomycetota bacterium]